MLLSWGDLAALVNVLEETGPADTEYQAALQSAWAVLDNHGEGLFSHEVGRLLMPLALVKPSPKYRAGLAAVAVACGCEVTYAR